MGLKDIKRGKWYQTTNGIGQALTVGGTHPPSVEFLIVAPMPLGKRYLRPRDVQYEVPEPKRE